MRHNNFQLVANKFQSVRVYPAIVSSLIPPNSPNLFNRNAFVFFRVLRDTAGAAKADAWGLPNNGQDK